MRKIISNILTISVITMCLVFVLNVILDYYYEYQTARYSPMSINYSTLSEAQKNAYAHMTAEDVENLLKQTWQFQYGGYSYTNWMGYKAKPRQTEFVNVSKYGFRSTPEEINLQFEPNNATWFFGGSTMFGYGVTDKETIPYLYSQLSGERVFNFGNGKYYSEQENRKLELLLKYGFKPKRVIFLDGVNEKCDIGNEKWMSEAFDRYTHFQWKISDMFKPILNLVLTVVQKISPKTKQETAFTKNFTSFKCSRYGKEIDLNSAINFNLINRKKLCLAFDIDCMTFLQPMSFQGGFIDESVKQSEFDIIRGKYNHISSTFEKNNAINISDVFNSSDRHLYVDRVHYSKQGNQIIASEILKHTGN